MRLRLLTAGHVRPTGAQKKMTPLAVAKQIGEEDATALLEAFAEGRQPNIRTCPKAHSPAMCLLRCLFASHTLPCTAAGKSGDEVGLGKDLDMSDEDDEATQDGAEEDAAASARSAAGVQAAAQPAAIEVS